MEIKRERRERKKAHLGVLGGRAKLPNLATKNASQPHNKKRGREREKQEGYKPNMESTHKLIDAMR